MDSTFYIYLSLLLAPICSAITWISTHRKRKLENINSQQETITMLLDRNKELTQEIIKLQRDVIELQKNQARLISILTPEQLVLYQQQKQIR